MLYQAVAALLLTCPQPTEEPTVNRPIIIAHRGASGYLPEHTLPAKALAYAMGADFLEQDVVLTRDDVPIVLHDIHLDEVTNVAERFPGRARGDGRHYAVDFALDEIRTLRVRERFDPATGAARSPARFPVGRSRFEIPTLREEIELVQGLNHSTGRRVGIYPEIKNPAWHRQHGKDISRIVLSLLEEYGYVHAGEPIFVQCFDAAETRRMREELGTKLPLIQLIAAAPRSGSDEHAALVTDEGLRQIAQYAQGIGPALSRVVTGVDANGRPVLSDLVSLAHRHGLLVHPYTFRADAVPSYVADFEGLLKLFLVEARVDGLFSDYPDRTRSFIDGLLRGRDSQP